MSSYKCKLNSIIFLFLFELWSPERIDFDFPSVPKTHLRRCVINHNYLYLYNNQHFNIFATEIVLILFNINLIRYNETNTKTELLY